MVEKKQGLDQWCFWQGWNKTNSEINGAEGKGGIKPKLKSMVQKAMESQCFSKKRTDTKSQKQNKQEKE